MIDYNEPYPEMPPGSPIVCGAEPPAPLYIVTCPDGKIRHADPFLTRRDAEQWSEWGHACRAGHIIQ